MQLALFWIFSLLMLIFGAAVIFLRSPVSSREKTDASYRWTARIEARIRSRRLPVAA